MDYWDLLPDEIAYIIFSYLVSAKDVLNCNRVCRKFKLLIQSYVQSLNNENVMKISSCTLVNFRNLKTLGENIFIKINKKNPVGELSKFDRINFYIGKTTFNSFLESTLAISKRLPLSEKYPDFRFTISGFDVYLGRYIVLIFEDGKFMFHGIDDDMLPLYIIDVIGKIWNLDKRLTFYKLSMCLVILIISDCPNMKIIYTPLIGSAHNELTITNRKFKRFLRKADFGLVDPRRSPSDSNPSLSVLTKRIADIGMTNFNTIISLLNIYTRYNQIQNKRAEVTIDETMHKYLTPHIKPNTIITYEYLKDIAWKMCIKEIHSMEEIIETQIPQEIDYHEYLKLQDQICDLSQLYNTLQNK